MSAIKKYVLEESEVDKLLIAIDNMNAKDLDKQGWLDSKAKPKSVIEKYIIKVMKLLGHADADGYEWWIHEGQISNAEGNSPHFDKNETLAEEKGIIKCPKSVLVTYLSSSGQPTNICDIKPKDDNLKDTIEECNYFIWSYPKEGNIIQFDGNLLHGVPPGNPNDDRVTFMINVWDKKEDCDIEKRCPYEDAEDISLTDGKIKHPIRDKIDIDYNEGAIFVGGLGAYQLQIPTLKSASKEEDFYIARKIQKVYFATNEEEFKKNQEKLKND
jgi:hypothetical protein